MDMVYPFQKQNHSTEFELFWKLMWSFNLFLWIISVSSPAQATSADRLASQQVTQQPSSSVPITNMDSDLTRSNRRRSSSRHSEPSVSLDDIEPSIMSSSRTSINKDGDSRLQKKTSGKNEPVVLLEMLDMKVCIVFLSSLQLSFNAPHNFLPWTFSHHRSLTSCINVSLMSLECNCILKFKKKECSFNCLPCKRLIRCLLQTKGKLFWDVIKPPNMKFTFHREIILCIFCTQLCPNYFRET